MLLPVVTIVVGPGKESQDLRYVRDFRGPDYEVRISNQTLRWEKRIVSSLIETSRVCFHFINQETLDRWISDPYIILDGLCSDLGHYKSTQVFGS